ncbi:MAG: cyclopropane fatty acyl phospholipid synthase [Betaproteobacteria bacterium]|nr:cyclopropane fatty acyl phospholipid synthase [Betaproteobacteria bacterium]
MSTISLGSHAPTPEHNYKSSDPAIPATLKFLADLAGVRFNGIEPWDIQVTNPRVYRRILIEGSLGFGEAYMDGWWECDRLDQLFNRLLTVDTDIHLDSKMPLRSLGRALRHALFNLQSIQRAFHVGEQHYDIGNDVFETMLDPTMSYSCGYWQKANTLEEAQRDKLDMVCRKLELRPGERVLDIGCGWGSFAQYAAMHYGVEVLGITISKEQQKLASNRCAGLPVTIELMDYRTLAGQYDKIVSIGMFEHVGRKNYVAFFSIIDRLLKEHGLFLLHTIGNHVKSLKLDEWMDKYVFPNGLLPSAAEIAESVEGRFLIDDWHSFGPDYDRTLMAWWENFEQGWPNLVPKYSSRFYRMWKYYLLSCAGFFRSRQGQLWQLVLSKRQRSAGYRSVR